MKVIICGGRSLADTPTQIPDGLDRRPYQEWLDEALHGMAVTAVISGRAAGGDRIGEKWARRHGRPVDPYPADWGQDPRLGGFRRNQRMVAVADATVVLPGSNGTRDTWARSVAKGILVIVHPLMAARWPHGPAWRPIDFSAA